ncbi:O-antigen translocase [Flavobacterium sp. K5-23]|nr:O-antigen translocase [Flavobacterium sp. K5-23]
MFKITSLNSMSVLLKIGIGLVTSKLLAVFVGPSGIALVGNLRNFISSLEGISTLGFQNGIVKYVAENKDDNNQLKKIISTVFFSLLFVGFFLSGFLFFFADYWCFKILGNNDEYLIVFKALALALPWYSISIFLASVLNGKGRFKKVIWINSIGNVIGLILSLVLILQFRTLGALLSIVISPALLFFVTFYYINKEIPFWNSVRIRYFDFHFILKMASYSVMVLVSAVFGPLVFLAIRTNLIQSIGIEQAGFWETMMRISTYYLLFVSTILSVYFLPKLVESKNNLETKKVFWSFYKNIIPLFVVGVTLIYFARFFIVQLLFTDEFLPVTTLFFWQIVGDVLKVASLILGFQFFAKKLTVPFVLTELLSLTTLYFSSKYLITVFGVEGVVIAHALTYFVYLTVLVVYFRKSLF